MSRETARSNEARYRANNKEKLREKRKVSWQAALLDPAKMAKIQASKQIYRTRHRKRLADKQREWVKNNPDKVREMALQAAYGVGLDAYNQKLNEQNGVCAICGGPDIVAGRSLSVDHDHVTGQVRGLLCGRCNKGIGLLQEDPEILLRAVDYLKKWGIVIVPSEDSGGAS